jgi:hypothetical protein
MIVHRANAAAYACGRCFSSNSRYTRDMPKKLSERNEWPPHMPLVAFRIPKHLAQEIEAWRRRYPQMDKSTAIRCLVALGLKSRATEVRDPATLDLWGGAKTWVQYRHGEKPQRR